MSLRQMLISDQDADTIHQNIDQEFQRIHSKRRKTKHVRTVHSGTNPPVEIAEISEDAIPTKGTSKNIVAIPDYSRAEDQHDFTSNIELSDQEIGKII